MTPQPITGRVGVAISTTGDPHRMDLLDKAVCAWDTCLPEGSSLFVTVDGNREDVARVAEAVSPWTYSVFQVGEPWIGNNVQTRDGRLGVAANKNTGIELLMDVGYSGFNLVQHLFLSDDDMWPKTAHALDLHAGLGTPAHSMVNWGGHRLDRKAFWTWPRGSLLYARRAVIDEVGGMVEAFGPGGHEHVEWSRRIHAAGYTADLYQSPRPYEQDNGMGARRFWHAEDMQRPGEPRASLMSRRRHLTSVRRRDGDAAHIDALLDHMAGSTAFVPYEAHANQRDSATLYHSN